MTSETKLLALIDEYNEKIVDLYNEYYNGVYFAYTFKRYEWKKLRTQEIETWFSNSIERAFKEGGAGMKKVAASILILLLVIMLFPANVKTGDVEKVITNSVCEKVITNSVCEKEYTREIEPVLIYENYKKSYAETMLKLILDKGYTKRDIKLLAAAMQLENGDNSNLCLLYTGSVILNRVKASYYPDTIEGVLLQRGQYAKHTVNNLYTVEISKRVYKLAQELLLRGSIDNEIIFQSQFNTLGTIKHIVDGEYFAY